ncbi:signal peptidase I [Chloroflexota bacterium]
MKTFFQETLTTLILAVVIFFGLQTTIGNYSVDGPSMRPNFQDGQLLLVNKLVYKFHKPERGDVIIFRPPNDLHDDYIKRIIGLPGEIVDIEDGIVYVHKANDEVLTLNEPYITNQASFPYEGSKIPEDAYFVLGDNRNNSLDSRAGWLVPRHKIIGKVWLSTWPPGKWGLVASYSYKRG